MIPTGPAADYIEERWQTYLADARQRQAHLFDAPVLCLLKWESLPAPTGKSLPTLHLTLCPTTYKNFLVTTLRDRPWFQQHAPQLISPVLGNSILLTYQGQALLGLRSPKVSAYPHRAHVIGGVFDRLLPPGQTTDATPILDHLYTEMHEEVGISPHDLAATPRLLGLFRDPALAQPELLWHAELSTPPQTFISRHQDPEHSRLLLISLQPAAPTTQLSRPILTPLAQMGLALLTQEKTA